MQPTLKAPGAKRLKLNYEGLLSNVAFNFYVRRYILDKLDKAPHVSKSYDAKAGRCRLTPANPR